MIVPIVEGDGEVQAFPILLRRLAPLLAPNRAIDAARPIRVNRSKVVKEGELERYVDLATRQHGGDGAVIVLLDADDDCAADLGPALLARAEAVRPGSPVTVVIAVREYEAWFLAAAASLRSQRGLPDDLEAAPSPENVRDAKGWLQSRRIDGLAYSPTIDQPALSAVVDLDAVRERSPSFDKLCRELERLISIEPEE